ncbi:hypothetical protein D3C78_1218650 [compost metagenome]
MVPVSYLLGQGEEGQWLLHIPLGLLDGIAAELGVGAHDLPLLGGQLAWLEQNMVGNADLADVVQRGGAAQQIDVIRRQCLGKAGVTGKGARQQPYIGLGAQDVIAGLGIADLRQMGQRPDGDLLDQIVFGHPARHLGLQGRILIVQAIPGLLGLQLGAHARLDDDRLDGFGDVVDGPE